MMKQVRVLDVSCVVIYILFMYVMLRYRTWYLYGMIVYSLHSLGMYYLFAQLLLPLTMAEEVSSRVSPYYYSFLPTLCLRLRLRLCL